MRRFFHSHQGRYTGGFKNPVILVSRYISSIRSFCTYNPVAVNYAIDGLLVLGALSVAANNNSIFALRLGAGEFHLAMLQFLPQALNLLLLIPMGLFTDSLVNKRRMLTGSLILSAIFYLAVAVVGFNAQAQPLLLFLAFVSLGLVGIMMYSLAWQGYFPEVVESANRNTVLTLRARMSIIVSLIVPLITGGVLAAIPSERGKIIIHQVFYTIIALMLIANAIHLRKINAIDPAPPKKLQVEEIKKASKRLLKNKPFLIFTGVALFFHMTWHLDWTLFFIGQANYLMLNEFQLGLVVVGSTLAQFLTLKFWSKRNQRFGVEKPIIFGILGLTLPPIVMIFATTLPLSIGPTVFMVLNAFTFFGFSTITLNFFQCLMPVLDEEYRSFSVSVYSSFIALSNAVMPMAGVAIYRGFGGDVRALRIAFIIAIVLRIFAAALWWLRIKYFHSSFADCKNSQE